MKDVTSNTIFNAANGDLSAFEEIFKTYTDYVFNAALRIVRNPEDAEEITQEVFLEVYRNLSRFRFRSALSTWIYRITINTAINYRKKNVKARTVGYNDAIRSVSVQNSVDDAVEKEYTQNLIQTLLGRLTAAQKRCIELRIIQGLSYRQIAKTLKINLSAVRSRLKRARKKLLELRKEVIPDVL